jgi:hypothetical protein
MGRDWHGDLSMRVMVAVEAGELFRIVVGDVYAASSRVPEVRIFAGAGVDEQR